MVALDALIIGIVPWLVAFLPLFRWFLIVLSFENGGSGMNIYIAAIDTVLAILAALRGLGSK
ncbi:hypothetical protein ACQ5SO_10670 [Rhodovulum sp. DZ06]|uniref:hypothetical protein n=1 Tax=Rhodovulum sp. DZ06 TaxID=3425126 RepID=UPI003D33548C